MEEVAPQQYWIRNEDGKQWGPLLASTLEILLPQMNLTGRVQASVDGETYVQVGRFPELREVLGEEWWGIDPKDTERLPPPPGLPPLDPSALAPGVALDPSALAPADPALAPPVARPAPPPPSAPEPEPDLSIPEQGDLSSCSVLRLAFGITVTGTTARVELQTPAGKSVVHFKKGIPAHVDSEISSLGDWLVEKGHLDAAGKAQADSGAAKFAGSFTGSLFGQGLMDPGSGFQHLAAWATEVYGEILQLSQGTFTVGFDVPPPPDAFPLGTNPYQPLVKAVRMIPVEEVRARLGTRLEAPAMKTNVSGSTIEDLGLGPQETRLYPLFNGVHSAAELAAEQGEAGPILLRLTLLLAECRFLSFDGVVEAAAPAAQPDVAPAAQPDVAPAAQPDVAPAAQPETKAETERDWAKEEKKAEGMLKRVTRGDHFTVLGLKRGCTDEAVKEAFTNRIRAFHPDRASGAPEKLQESFRAIFDRVTEANRDLETDSKRRAYLNALAEEALAKEAAEKNAEVWDPIEDLIAAKDYATARDTLNKMIGENPGNAGAFAYLAWVTLLGAENRESVKPKVFELITRALKTDPSCGEAFLNAARIAKAFGDKENMTLYLTKARALGAKIRTKKKT